MAGKLLKYLPRSMSFSIPSSSSTISKAPAMAFSGPIVSIIPKEARRKKKDSGSAADEAFEEPTSPKVSCIGQVKHKNCSRSSSSKIKNNNKSKKHHQSFNERIVVKREEETKKKMTKKPSAIQGMFRRKVRPGRPPVPGKEEEEEEEEEEVAPEVGSMRRYASGRETLGDFDWRKVVVGPEAEEEEEEEDVLVAHSGPILLGGGVVAVEVEKRKEVNLWKRRTLAPPGPLRL